MPGICAVSLRLSKVCPVQLPCLLLLFFCDSTTSITVASSLLATMCVISPTPCGAVAAKEAGTQLRADLLYLLLAGHKDQNSAGRQLLVDSGGLARRGARVVGELGALAEVHRDWKLPACDPDCHALKSTVVGEVSALAKKCAVLGTAYMYTCSSNSQVN